MPAEKLGPRRGERGRLARPLPPGDDAARDAKAAAARGPSSSRSSASLLARRGRARAARRRASSRCCPSTTRTSSRSSSTFPRARRSRRRTARSRRWPTRSTPFPRSWAPRSTRAPPRRTTSTASCATTSCGRAPHQGDVQVTLAPQGERRRSSHAIAKAARPLVDAIGAALRRARQGRRGPARAAGAGDARRRDLRPRRRRAAARSRGRSRMSFAQTEGVVDVDWYVESPREKAVFRLDREKAGLAGIREADVAATLRLALGRRRGRRDPAAGRARADPARRDAAAPSGATTSAALAALSLPARGRAPRAALGDRPLRARARGDVDLPQEPEAGRLRHGRRRRGARRRRSTRSRRSRRGSRRSGCRAATASRRARRRRPFDTARYGMKWDGEWHVTYEVFRDLGLAFAAVLVLIYVLVVGWFRSFTVPLVIMAPIPLTLVGILPGARPLRRLLHRDLDDRLHRRRRDHRPQLDHPRRLHRAAPPRRACRSRRRCSTRARCASARCS